MRSLQHAAAVLGLSVSPLMLMGCGSAPTPTPTAAPAAAPTAAPRAAPTPAPVYGECADVLAGTPLADSDTIPTVEEYATALAGLDMDQVKTDMRALLVDSNDCWPADYGTYAGLMIRLAWHCAGTYRGSDGLGGCGGGRQRFEPERSWPDNTNLDKARALVAPLKAKYGHALSWGDLFILAGTESYRAAGTPISKMCFGRIDQTDGSASTPLDNPCPVQGQCDEPWGATTVGLIYVNPAGPMGVPDAAGSVADIRRTFGTMGHSDRSTVALIGGGHTLGKTHGACDAPGAAGNPPNVAFAQGTHIWKGTCGTGKGADTSTSGFEGTWTSDPTTWDNEFFRDLQDFTWETHTGPGGNPQWRIAGDNPKNIIRLTSDVALLEDAAYAAIVAEFAADQTAFDEAFDVAWFDLTTTNVGGEWSTAGKCDDGSTPPPPRMRKDAGPENIIVNV